jgi:hypothetical protein
LAGGSTAVASGGAMDFFFEEFDLTVEMRCVDLDELFLKEGVLIWTAEV